MVSDDCFAVCFQEICAVVFTSSQCSDIRHNRPQARSHRAEHSGKYAPNLYTQNFLVPRQISYIHIIKRKILPCKDVFFRPKPQNLPTGLDKHLNGVRNCSTAENYSVLYAWVEEPFSKWGGTSARWKEIIANFVVWIGNCDVTSIEIWRH